MTFEEELQKILDKGMDEAALDMTKTLEEAYGEVPYIFRFMRQHPELLITKVLHNNAILRTSALDTKTVELISIAVSSAIRCSHCLEMHIRVAKRLGISEEEIAATVFLAGSLVNASVLATATRELQESRGACNTCAIGNGCEMGGEEE